MQPTPTSGKGKRRYFSPAEKVAILKRHLLGKEPVSNLCDELQIQPCVFYQWQRQFFENGAAAFANDRAHQRQQDAKDKKIEQLQAKLHKKNEVVAELMEEHVSLKKELGEL